MEAQNLEFLVDDDGVNKRLDAWLGTKMNDVSRNAIQRKIDAGEITVNGKSRKANYRLKQADRITVVPDEPKCTEVLPENIPLSIVYEDQDLLVINKPRGIVVHPAVGNENGTLVNAVLFHCGAELSGIGGVMRPGIVHRIDKDTTGLLVVAKNDVAHLRLTEQLSDRTLSREYYALVHGNIKEDRGTIDAPIGRSPKDRKRMAVVHDPSAREAITDYEVLERFQVATLVRCKLRTGRTHQIRVHMKYIGHPIYGDPVYGVKNEPFHLNGQLLHAKRIGFVHPVSGEHVSYETDLPEDFQHVLNIFRQKQ